MNGPRPPHAPLPAALRPLTVPASYVYRAIIDARNRRYDRGRGVQRVDRPVISVGNITTGGAGKTPMVAWIARQLLEAGHRPVIAMRGYMARPGELSDEQAEYRELLADVPVLANPDRVAALHGFLPRHAAVDCVILDDGFQHRRLHRDLDLVVIDAEAGTLLDELLPAGNLREPLAALRRADAVIVTHARQIDPALRGEIERHHGRPPLAWTTHAWRSLSVVCGSLPLASATNHEQQTTDMPIAWLRGKRVVTMLGIGRPTSVIAQLESLGASVMANIPAGDHERYDRAKLTMARGLCGGCDAMLVTLKDWVKIRELIAKDDARGWPCAMIVPRLEIDVIEGREALRRTALESAGSRQPDGAGGAGLGGACRPAR